MKNELKIFENENFGKIRTIVENNEILFCGVDVAKALGYSNTRDAIHKHCKRGTSHFATHPQNPEKTIEMKFIPESDMYRLIIKSKLPQAEEFEKWVFEEVLPSIRKHGGYLAGQEKLSEVEMMARSLLFAKSVIDEKEKENKELQKINNQLLIENKSMEKKANYFDNLVNTNLLLNFRDTSKEFGIGERDMINFLLSKKVLFRNKAKQLRPYSTYVKKGFFEIKEVYNVNLDKSFSQTFVTVTGREYILKLLTKHKIIQ